MTIDTLYTMNIRLHMNLFRVTLSLNKRGINLFVTTEYILFTFLNTCYLYSYNCFLCIKCIYENMDILQSIELKTIILIVKRLENKIHTLVFATIHIQLLKHY